MAIKKEDNQEMEINPEVHSGNSEEISEIKEQEIII